MGAELEPAFAALARWGMGSPLPRDGDLSTDSVMLRIRTFFDARALPAWTAAYRVHLERETYAIRVVDGELVELNRGEGGPADVSLECDRWTMHALLRGAESVTAAVRAGRLRMTGPATQVRRLVAAVAAG
jgi:alkyl sulfatase BDS1-like metallo-beta-lactamase superfamily hydrolase